MKGGFITSFASFVKTDVSDFMLQSSIDIGKFMPVSTVVPATSFPFIYAPVASKYVPLLE